MCHWLENKMNIWHLLISLNSIKGMCQCSQTRFLIKPDTANWYVIIVNNLGCGCCLQGWSGKTTSWRWRTLATYALKPFPRHHGAGLLRPGRDTALCPKPACSSPMLRSQTLSCEIKGEWHTHKHTYRSVCGDFYDTAVVKAVSLSQRLPPAKGHPAVTMASCDIHACFSFTKPALV